MQHDEHMRYMLGIYIAFEHKQYMLFTYSVMEGPPVTR